MNFSNNKTIIGLHIDKDTYDVLSYMERNLTTDKLVPVAKLINDLAPILWGHYSSNINIGFGLAVKEEIHTT